MSRRGRPPAIAGAQKMLRPAKCLDEEQVLQPASPDVDADDWPIFVLSNAIVYDKNGEQANLLNAELDGPYTIQASLEVEKEFRHLQIKKTKGCIFQLNDVKGFSVGVGPITIWAGGRAGWFEIVPAPEYQSTYDAMAEAVRLFFFLLDTYEESAKKKKTTAGDSMNVERLLSKYASSISSSRDEVLRQCIDHAGFLISNMRKPSSIDWAETNFFQWLVNTCPDVYGRFMKPTGKARGRPSKSSQTTNTPPATESKRDNTSITVNIIYNTMTQLHDTQTLRRQNQTIAKVAEVLYQRFYLDDKELAREMIKCHAEALLRLMGDDWALSPIRQKLEDAMSRPNVKTDLYEFAKNKFLVGRRRPLEPENLEKHEIATSPGPEAPRVGRPPGVKNKASLAADGPPTNHLKQRGRPKIQSRNESTDASQVFEELNIQAVLDPDSSSDIGPKRSSRSGKGAGLRPIKSVQRPGYIDAFDSQRSRKRRRLSQSPSNEDSPDVTSDDDIQMDNAELLEMMEGSSSPQSLPQLEIVSEPLLSTASQGPRGLWKCEEENCGFEVPGADKAKGRAKVQAHFLEHADEITAKEHLVLQEARPHLPIDHLLEKIRAMGESTRLSEQKIIAGRIVPQPIKRSLEA